MAELKEPFASFWAYLRNNFDEARVSQMLNHLHGSLLTELQNPFAVGYSTYRRLFHSSPCLNMATSNQF